ncbi:putative UDP-glucose dehydrogenase [Lasiosphaeria ovina]|uniref:UDP-glucose dehydrogenase n=1 Tax=Lasiosphaeria ovina TaxID=92902 RepID=A0AAE0KIK3_9PEZI|nr:putative UDP-glucose dehydrogenase [Lasiosphaeria ovina]
MSSTHSSSCSLDKQQADSLEGWSGLNSPTSFKTDASSVGEGDGDGEGEGDGEGDSAASPFNLGLSRRSLVAVIGVGYVGEHLVDVFSAQYPVVGFDVSEARVASLKKHHLDSGDQRKITFSSDESDLRVASYFLVSVPTLLQSNGEVNLVHLQSAINTVARNARPGSTVVIESSVAIGMTRQLLGPLAISRGLFVGMSPERVDPGRVSPPAQSIPKIVSGLDDLVPGSLDRVARLYGMVFKTVVRVSKPEVAEMTKLYENCQRMMAIAYANEMADACIPHDINPFEVAAAAATKPFGYLPVDPSIGVGGHCIPVNPFYLFSNCDFPLLRAAAEKTAKRPVQIADRLLQSLKDEIVPFSEPCNFRPRVLVAGLGFKSGQSHIANSPSVRLACALADSDKVDIMFVDPLVDQAAVPNVPRLDERHWTRQVLDSFDSIVVASKQPGLDFGILSELRHARVENWCNVRG